MGGFPLNLRGGRTKREKYCFRFSSLPIIDFNERPKLSISLSHGPWFSTFSLLIYNLYSPYPFHNLKSLDRSHFPRRGTKIFGVVARKELAVRVLLISCYKGTICTPGSRAEWFED